MLCITSGLQAMQTLEDKLVILNNSLTSLKQKCVSLKNSLQGLKDKLSTPKISTIHELVARLNKEETNGESSALSVLNIFDNKILEQRFPMLSKNTDIRKLLKDMVHEALSSKLLEWDGGLGSRLLLIFNLLEDALNLFGDKRDQPFTHVEYAEVGGLQPYMLVYGLVKAGFTNITVHTVAKGDPPTKSTERMHDRINKLDEVATGKTKISTMAFNRDNYLRKSSKRWSLQNDTINNTIKCGSYSMVYPSWDGPKFENSNTATNFLEAIVQTFDPYFYLFDLNGSTPLIYIMLGNNASGKYKLRYDLGFELIEEIYKTNEIDHYIELSRNIGNTGIPPQKIELNANGKKRFWLLNRPPFNPKDYVINFD